MSYCDNCQDKLCENCVDFPWECPQAEGGGEICSQCKEDMAILRKLWIDYQTQAERRLYVIRGTIVVPIEGVEGKKTQELLLQNTWVSLEE